MIQEHESIEGYFKNKFKTQKWLSFHNIVPDYNNKIYVNKDFHEEHRSCARKFRCNKKNPTKYPGYFEDVQGEPKFDGPVARQSTDHIYETAIPNTLTDTVDELGSRAFNCKYSNNGEEIYVATQTGTSIFRVNGNNRLEQSSNVLCDNIHWAIMDAQVSSNNKFMIQTTIIQYAHMFDIEKRQYVKEFKLDKGEASENQQVITNKMKFFSLDIHGNDKEMIVGCSKLKDGGFVQTYDLERELTKSSTLCHKDDVNSVCYLEKASSNVFLTGSDDGTCKLWDTRILKSNEPVGTFYGHVSGLTCVESKDDGRYFISNSKDQSMKLWDIRRFSTKKRNHPVLKYDYRCEVLTPDHIQEIKERQKKVDDAVMTFWGHQVHLTLIRCKFSPLHGTGQRYVYTGSFDGRVYIYDTVSGENVVTLELPKDDDNIFHSPVVRDCAWHPYSQSLVNTSFRGSVCRWEYMDLRDAERVEDEESEMEDDTEQTYDNAQSCVYRNNSANSCSQMNC